MRSALILALVAWASAAFAAEDPAPLLEQQVKAAFLYKFAAYVEWPPGVLAEAESPIVIGVASADRIAQELDQAVRGRTIAGRTVQVRRLEPGESADDCCHILFIGAGERRRAKELLARSQGRPVLTVTDSGVEHPKGSVINFLAYENRVRFDISREAAERNGLVLRSQLLAVARQVVGP
jgi:hypothetical protein